MMTLLVILAAVFLVAGLSLFLRAEISATVWPFLDDVGGFVCVGLAVLLFVLWIIAKLMLSV
jgi:hypothetical protein